MANEARFPTNRPGLGTTPKFLVWNDVGQVHNGSAFVTYVTANRASYLKSVTEQGTSSGVYVGSLGFTPTTDIQLDLYDGSSEPSTNILIGVQSINLASEGTSVEDILGAEVPNSFAQGTAGWALGRIGTGRITTVSPISGAGDVEIVMGDSYLIDHGRALTWTDADETWPILTEAEISFEVGDGEIVAGGEVVTATGSNKQVRVQLRGEQTESPEAGTYDYNLVAVFPGTGSTEAGGVERVTLARATCTVVDREDMEDD